MDADSEELLLLTSNGQLQHQLTNPRFGHGANTGPKWRGRQQKRIWNRSGGASNSKKAPAARREPNYWIQLASAIAERNPPIRHRLSVPTTWLQLELTEGRNRQVRRMTAAIGFPTLRLIRWSLDLMDGQPPLSLEGLEPGQWRWLSRLETKRMANLRG